MKNFKGKTIILVSLLFSQFIFAQNFIDDLYYNDSEVDYSFLYINENTETISLHDSTYTEEWDDTISYEERIKKFHNPYHWDYYWDYGWNSPNWYNWHYPSWSLGLNYHNYPCFC